MKSIGRYFIFTIVILGLLTFFRPVHAGDKIDPQGFLAIAKVAGACGIMDSLVDFQKKTKMQGGDEFVSRFWAWEAARLGNSSLKEYLEECNSAISAYNKLWEVMESSAQVK